MRAGRTNHVHIHIVNIQVAGTRTFCIVNPTAAVTGGDGNNRIALGQTLHQLLIELASSEPGLSSAKRKVDRIRTQNNRILQCSHIVGSICAAVLTKNLHDNNLSLRRNALHLHGVKRPDKATLPVRNVSICGSDAGNM